jgi:NTE family protein
MAMNANVDDVHSEPAAGEPPVGVVLAGAGARGAYEAGMLSVLLPGLGDQPKIFVGTSAGAINVALFASLAHLPAEEAAARALAKWRNIHPSMVFRPAWATLPTVGFRYVAGLLGIPGRLTSLLDTGPLLRSLEKLIDWDRLHANVRTGRVRTLALATTEFDTGRTRVFYEGDPPGDPFSDDERAIDYEPTFLTHEHVAASAAIPVIFPPVRIGTEKTWHMDGGVRLNAPLKPAIALGAKSLVVIATDPGQYKPALTHPARRHPPSMQEAVDQIAHGVLADRMVEDLKTLVQMNRVLMEGVKAASPSGRPYERMPFIFGGPQSSSSIGDRAAQALSETLHGVRALRNPDLTTLNVMLSMGTDSRSDLISYILFEPGFIERAIALGQSDAQMLRWKWDLDGRAGAGTVARTMTSAA